MRAAHHGRHCPRAHTPYAPAPSQHTDPQTEARLRHQAAHHLGEQVQLTVWSGLWWPLQQPERDGPVPRPDREQRPDWLDQGGSGEPACLLGQLPNGLRRDDAHTSFGKYAHRSVTTGRRALRCSAMTTPWSVRAVCLGIAIDLFFLTGSSGPAVEQISTAKDLCARCDVRTGCLGWLRMTERN
jgi:hypothetical protein